MKHILFTFLSLLLVSVSAFAQSDKPLLLRQPTVNETNIVFVFAGDLWTVSRQGGAAERLTSGVGQESNPIFSPDGNWLAFTGEYDGNVDAYVMPAKGGEPKRLTYHPGNDAVIGWNPDGKSVVFLSTRGTGMPTPKMYMMPVSGEGLPTELPFPMASGGASFSPDGAKIAYMPLGGAFAQWKKYRGGRTTKIWIGNIADSSVEEIPKQNSNDYTPMWLGDKIYFLSDRNNRNVTLYSYDLKTKKVVESIPNTGLDLKTASAGAGMIVYEQFGSINLFDPKSGKANKVNISLNGDLPSVRPRYEKVAPRISNASISPTGARAVFEARGEILTVPVEKGNARNLTNSSGAADRDPAWSPDGKWIAYFSDASGEYELHLRDQTGMGELKKINLGSPSYFYTPKWSPDSKKISYTDKRLNLWYVDIDKGTPVKVDTNTFENPYQVVDANWSPDNKWIVYSKQLRNHLCAIFVHSLETGKSTQITDGLSDARFPAFDKNGKYLYFTASTDTGPTTGWLDMSSIPFQTSRSVYAVVLKNDDPSPLSPESDEEKIQDAKADALKPPAGKPEPVSVKIDFDKITQRIVTLPMAGRSYQGLMTGKTGTVFLLEAIPPTGTTNQPLGLTVHRFDLDKRRAEKVLDNVTLFDISANGEKMLFGQFPGRYTVASTFLPMRPGEGAVNVGDMEISIDPRAEWKQMYREVWRIQRDFFYDPNFHGLDIKAAEKRYEVYLDNLSSRSDLNYLFQEMLGNMTVGHHNAGGGDLPQPTRYNGGLLGADYKIENGRYRIAKIFDGENWNPGTVAPLTQPGVNVKEGDYLLAVNGRELRSTDNIYAYFQQTAGKQIVIKVGANPDGKDARNVTVVPVGSEGGLRNLAWIEGNRRKVSELSGGKLAYVYLPNTGGQGYTNFNRYYFAQIDKQGAVIDERFNGGGSAADYIIDAMKRPLMNYWSTREGEDFTTPVGAIYGPKTMIINEYSSSGGDLMPWLFRESKIGLLVGKRTWGGLVGIYNYPVLVDGGTVTAPRVAFRNLKGELDVENKGVAPDVEVDLDPKIWRAGRDPQLEKAVEVTLEALKKNPVQKPANGTFPNYQKP